MSLHGPRGGITGGIILLTAALANVVAAAPPAQDGTVRVPVRVVEVAGGRVYIEPGESAGVRRGDRGGGWHPPPCWLQIGR